MNNKIRTTKMAIKEILTILFFDILFTPILRVVILPAEIIKVYSDCVSFYFLQFSNLLKFRWQDKLSKKQQMQ